MTSVAILHDGKRMVSVDKSVQIWNVVTRRIEHVLEGHLSYVTSVAISHDGTCVVHGLAVTQIRGMRRQAR